MLAAAYQVNVWRLKRWQGHAVVCGVGKRGRQVALALLAEGHRVVEVTPIPWRQPHWRLCAQSLGRGPASELVGIPVTRDGSSTE